MAKLMVLLVVCAGVIAGCDQSAEFSGECTFGGVDVTTTLSSCDEALAEGRRLAVANGLATSQDSSGVDAVVAAHCLGLATESANSKTFQQALRAAVCV